MQLDEALGQARRATQTRVTLLVLNHTQGVDPAANTAPADEAAALERLQAVHLALQAQCPLLLLPQIALCATRRQLVRRLGRLQFVNRLQKLVDLFAHPADVFQKLRVLSVLSLDLALQVLDSAIHVARRSLRLRLFRLVLVELRLKLFSLDDVRL